MNPKRQRLLIASLLAGGTIASGFLVWWSFLIVAFVAGFALQRRIAMPVRIATFAPAVGWLLACLVRDLFEDGRISTKLASLLHLQFSAAVYAAVFLVVAVPSFFAAFSGATFSKAFR